MLNYLAAFLIFHGFSGSDVDLECQESPLPVEWEEV